MKAKNKILMSVTDEKKHQTVNIVHQVEDAKPEDYYEFGSGWFELPNFYNDRNVMFKISTLKRKNKFGLRMLCMDFVVLRDDKQENIKEEEFKEVQRRMSDLGIKMCQDISMIDRKDYSMVIRQAEPWITERKR